MTPDDVGDESELLDRYWRGEFGGVPEPDLFLSLAEATENGPRLRAGEERA